MKTSKDFIEYLSEALGRLNDEGEISIAVKDNEGFRTKYIPLGITTADLIEGITIARDNAMNIWGESYE